MLLKNLDLLLKIDAHTHNVGTCERCKTIIEPLISKQWFVRMKPLAEPAIEAVKNGKIKFVPDRFSKIYYNWMENIQDWNISRQIVWGIPIPAKLCTTCDAGYVDLENTLTTCEKCGGMLVQETDSFDTWFSSGQWPFATLMNTKASDFEKYYPTQVDLNQVYGLKKKKVFVS